MDTTMLQEHPPAAANARGGRDLDRLAEIAAALCNAPMAFVAAFEDEVQVFRARVGFDMESTALGDSICTTVIAERADVVIPDLVEDPRTSGMAIVREHGLRFYAGHPVFGPEGTIIGSVCVLDVSPRPGGLTQSEMLGLGALADQASSVLTLRRSAMRREALLENHELRERHDRRRIARLSALVSLGDRLREARTPGEVYGIAAETLGLTLDAEQAGYSEVDVAQRIATVEHDWCRDEHVRSSRGRHRFEDHPGLFEALCEGREFIETREMVNDDAVRSHMAVPVVVHGRLAGVVYVVGEADREWAPDEIQFARGVADRAHETMVRMRLKEDRDLVVGEVGHRLKNLMAITRAIAMQTLNGRADADVVRDLDERLAAYSGAHDLLLAGSGHEAGLRRTADVVVSRLSAGERVTLDGPEITLNERATLALSLLVNELVTNALKHGSLSRKGGRARLAWRVEGDHLVMEWTERGGPPSVAPSRRGFGTRILEIGLHRVGGTELDYGRQGLTATFRAPLAEIIAV